MQRVTKEILMQSPSCSLELQRNWDDSGVAMHRFVMQRAGERNPQTQLLERSGHNVSRKDVHYAFYLFQKMQSQQKA